MKNKKEIIDFVKNNSYFDFEGEEDGTLNFSTRKNGSVSSETASSKDIAEGKLLKNKIEKKFQGLDIRIDVVDEWVLLFVYEKVIVEDEYKYIFKKDYQGQGFSNYHSSLDEFIKYANGWLDDVNWSDIKEKLNKITEYNDNQFTGWYWASPIILKRAGENGNKWGYNFYLIKARKKNSSYNDGGSIKSKGTFKPLGSAKELGITPKIEGHNMIAKCDCGEKFSYQNSKKNIVWECPECKGMKRINETKMADGGGISESEQYHYKKYLEFKDKAEQLLNSDEMPSKYETPKKGTRSYDVGKKQMELGSEAQKHFSMYLKLKHERETKMGNGGDISGKCKATKTIKFKNGLNYFEGLTYNFEFGLSSVSVSYDDGRFTTMSKEVFGNHFEKLT
jgi:hypothetical protein